MGIFLAIVGVLLLLASIIGSIVFLVLSLLNRKNDEKFKKNIKKLIISAASFIVSIILLIIAGAIGSNNYSNDTLETTSSPTSNKDEEKTAKKTVAFKYDDSIEADKNGNFKLPIKVIDGYTPKITEGDEAKLKKKDSNNYILTGKINKKDDSGIYYLDFVSNDDKQEETIFIENTKAYDSYKKEQKAAAKQKVRSKALQNENKLSYGMLIKAQDRYAGEPYHITKGHVMQAMEQDGETTLLVQITNKGYGFWDDIVYINYPNITDAVDDDFVEIWGTLGEKMDYDTQIGGSNSVPSMKADSIKVTGHLN